MQIEFVEIAAFGLTILLVIGCVLFHYEGLSILSRWLTLALLAPRRRIIVLIIGQLVLHSLEVLFFALGHGLLLLDPAFGELYRAPYSGLPAVVETGLGDLVYYSAVVYSTLGFGDIVPGGALRILSGAEAIAGLVLITWSASFMFLEMQRYWGR